MQVAHAKEREREGDRQTDRQTDRQRDVTNSDRVELRSSVFKSGSSDVQPIDWSTILLGTTPNGSGGGGGGWGGGDTLPVISSTKNWVITRSRSCRAELYKFIQDISYH